MSREAWEKREIAQAEKKIKVLEALGKQLDVEQKKRQRLENLALALALLFGLGIVFVAWFTDGQAVTGVVRALQSVESEDQKASENDQINCTHPRNKNTPYCLEKKAKIESDWRNTTVYGGETVRQFSLHGKQ